MPLPRLSLRLFRFLKMTTLTFQDTWTSFEGTPTSVRCTTSPHRDPIVSQDRKTALSIAIYLNCGDLSSGDSRTYLQGYCYGIEFVGRVQSTPKSNEVCVADLIESNDHQIHDLIHKVTRILVLKYHRPCYVQIASKTAEFTLNGADQINMLQNITKCIDRNVK